MEQYDLTQDIHVIFLEVPSFPEDVPATYERLHSLIPDNPARRYFGISHPDETGRIRYMAAAEISATDDYTDTGLQTFTIEKGFFAAKYIVNHFRDGNCIGDTFRELLKHPCLDPQGYCLEVYKNYTDLDVHCMVRILPQAPYN